MAYADYMRWMYRGKRPNWLARVQNRFGAAVAATGLVARYMQTLEVTGVKSGRTIALPIVVVALDGERYLVSMLGERAHWVHNVRAAGGQAVLVRGRREAINLEEVPAARRAPILKAYLHRAPGGRPHIPLSKDAPVEEFATIAADYPVFRVRPRAETISGRAG